MTVQEFYNWCKEKNLTDARIEIQIDGNYFVDVEKQNIFDYAPYIVTIAVET